MKNLLHHTRMAVCLLALLLLGATAEAQLPTNFPTLAITTYETNSVGTGNIFITSLSKTTNSGVYGMIVTNDGTPIWYQSTPTTLLDVKPLANGLLHYNLGNGNSYEGPHLFLDPSYTLLETLNMGNGYGADGHDLELLPNGNVLLMGYYKSPMDLSRVVAGGYPNASVGGAIIQELDAQRNVIWQWRSWDYFTFDPARFSGGGSASVNTWHVNAITTDTDANLLVSSITEKLILKINRQTGDVMWCLGGPLNQFTFANEDPAEAINHFGSHCVRRLGNGNILLLCNGNSAAARSTKIYEYQLDEVHKVATLIWSYTPVSPIYTAVTGDAQRLPNGNTFIGWGGGAPYGNEPACTEVTPSGHVVFELKFNDPGQSIYRAFRYPWPPQSQAISVTQRELLDGNTYGFDAAGVAVTVNSGASGYNSLTVTREPYAPRYPFFLARPPSVLPVRVALSENSLASLDADIAFDVASFGFTNAASLTVYYRQTTGVGLFAALPTDFNPVTGKITASLSLTASGNDFGEFIFGFPDLNQVPYPPILNAAENYRGVQIANIVAPLAAVPGTVYSVNQQLPVSLSWSPKGFAGSYELQIDTDPGFTAPIVDLPSQTDAFYVWSNAAPATTYYYRVKTSNDGGTSSWSSGAFHTTAPYVQVTVPNGGEAWRRGLRYFVQWNGNLPENVVIELYKGGVFNRSITTNTPDNGAFRWSIPASLTPGSDYAVKITSLTNSAMSSTSAAPFAIVDAPSIASNPARNPDGTFQFQFSAPGASQVTVWGASSFTPSDWHNLGTVPVTGGSGSFSTTSAYPFYRLSVP